ncbi:hypothetical protein MNBD_GAMMA12-2938 [hydrothermal vent metagenome]|uniref:Response regulatory domain-containing protein n=1 Tax=hydrothermal vent metagenome TaxID=652676 RepID=A0A3B0Z6I7_9ZZZZ
MVHGIVYEMGGHIVVSSIPSVGTEFLLYLPESENSGTPVVDSKSTVTLRPIKTNARLMVLDDDEGVCDYMCELLANSGYTVESFTNSVEALTRFSESPSFDIVITDYTMPGLNGIEFTQAIKKIDSNIRLLLITGYSDCLDEDVASEYGIDSVILKPFTSNVLLEEIRDLIIE